MPCFTLRIPDTKDQPATTREVPLTEVVSTYLRAIAPRANCDPCLAEALKELLEPVRKVAEELVCPEQFARKVGRCTFCRSTKRIVTRVDPSRF